MGAQDNKAVSRRFITEVFNDGKFEVADELLAEKFSLIHRATIKVGMSSRRWSGRSGARSPTTTARLTTRSPRAIRWLPGGHSMAPKPDR